MGSNIKLNDYNTVHIPKRTPNSLNPLDIPLPSAPFRARIPTSSQGQKTTRARRIRATGGD